MEWKRKKMSVGVIRIQIRGQGVNGDRHLWVPCTVYLLKLLGLCLHLLLQRRERLPELHGLFVLVQHLLLDLPLLTGLKGIISVSFPSLSPPAVGRKVLQNTCVLSKRLHHEPLIYIRWH